MAIKWLNNYAIIVHGAKMMIQDQIYYLYGRKNDIDVWEYFNELKSDNAVGDSGSGLGVFVDDNGDEFGYNADDHNYNCLIIGAMSTIEVIQMYYKLSIQRMIKTDRMSLSFVLTFVICHKWTV